MSLTLFLYTTCSGKTIKKYFFLQTINITHIHAIATYSLPVSAIEGKKLPGDINFRFASELIHCKLAESGETYTGSHVMYLHEFFITRLSC